MRRTRWLFLVAILAIIVSVGATYVRRMEIWRRNAAVLPKPLDLGLDAQSEKWTYVKSNGDCPIVRMSADSFRDIKDPPVSELEGVELRLYNKTCDQYDLVKSAKAQFDAKAKTLYSDGDVDIALNQPIEGEPHGRLLKIHSSGVTFQSETGHSSTDRAISFEFDQGGGTAVGGEYDPQTRELHLRSQVRLDWRGRNPEAKLMHIETGEAYYKERESKVWLLPWAKLQRDTLHIEGELSVVTLDHGDVREAEVVKGHGGRDEPERKIEFGADRLKLHFADGMEVDKIEGDQNGRLVSNAATMKTTVTANHLDLNFDTSDKDSELKTVFATGSSVAEAVPVPKPGSEIGDTRILKSETITLKMRDGGKDIGNVETAGPGTIDFVPNRPGAPKRFVKGDRIWVAYGDNNRIQSFRSINVSTRTEKPPTQKQPSPAPAVTESKELFATFDPQTSELATLDQKPDFRYQEGDRRARATHATLDQKSNLMTLDGAARMWDSTGSASADRILVNQQSGDFTAEGHVASTHQPDQKGKSSAMLATDEVMQARARRMSSTDNNQQVHYEGNAVAWQGANRVEADRLDIDRDAGVMEAHGKVKSSFADKDKKKDDPAEGDGDPVDQATAKALTPAAPIFTVVTAPDMVYIEDTRIVNYTGGVVMQRPDMIITSNEIRAFLKDADSDSSLDKAYADGTVKVVSTSEKLKRKRTATSEHSEYYADDGKVVMQGGQPQLVDTVKGETKAPKELIWFSNDDRLIVDGIDKAAPSKSRINRKKK